MRTKYNKLYNWLLVYFGKKDKEPKTYKEFMKIVSDHLYDLDLNPTMVSRNHPEFPITEDQIRDIVKHWGYEPSSEVFKTKVFNVEDYRPNGVFIFVHPYATKISWQKFEELTNG